jgi:hypothetical protein
MQPFHFLLSNIDWGSEHHEVYALVIRKRLQETAYHTRNSTLIFLTLFYVFVFPFSALDCLECEKSDILAHTARHFWEIG